MSVLYAISKKLNAVELAGLVQVQAFLSDAGYFCLRILADYKDDAGEVPVLIELLFNEASQVQADQATAR